MSERVITAMLTKEDFNKVLLGREKQQIELKLNEILMFDLFKGLSKRRAKNIYRLFYDKKT